MNTKDMSFVSQMEEVQKLHTINSTTMTQDIDEEYTNLDLSNFLKHKAGFASNGVSPAMYWVNFYYEGRKEAVTSGWRLDTEPPKSEKVRFYPAYTMSDFIHKIAPRLGYSIPTTPDKQTEI